MSAWSKVGEWLKEHGTGLVGLAGAVATGNVPAGVAAVASMVTEATGEQSPQRALAALQGDPETMVKLEQIAAQREADLRRHHERMLELQLDDAQAEHSEQQATIRAGDTSGDEYVRRTRPRMARQSWYGGFAYAVLLEIMEALGYGAGPDVWILGALLSPAAAYMGFRSVDKLGLSFGKGK